jgi:hypothetical protein
VRRRGASGSGSSMTRNEMVHGSNRPRF